MTLDDSILTMRLRVMRRAQELSSVTRACQEAGISRTEFMERLHLRLPTRAPPRTPARRVDLFQTI